MTEDGDRLITVFTIVLVLFIVLSVGILILAAVNAPSNETAQPPQTSWTLQRENATYVRIVHAGGEPVSTTNLSVTVNGVTRSVTWSGTLNEGESGLVRARPNTMVQLFWVGGRGDRALLQRWQLGDSETTTQ